MEEPMTSLSAGRPSKRPQDFNTPVFCQKRIHVSYDGGYMPNPHYAGADLGESQDVDMRDDSLDPTSVEPSPINTKGSDMEICYGAICDAYAVLNDPTAGKSLVQDGRRFQQFHITFQNDTFGLSSNKVFAVLDMNACKALQSLHERENVRATAIVETSRLMEIRATGSSKGISSLSINIYGPHDLANEVATNLSKAAAFLQHPLFLEPNLEYFNPQYFHPRGEMKCMTRFVRLGEADYRAKCISDEVERVFDSLDTMSWDDTAQPDAIITPLKSHQRAAVAFIQRIESHDACQSANRSLRQFIKIPPKDDIPSYSMGGILADIMGLGKTLSMISAIVSSLAQATDYESVRCHYFAYPAPKYRSRATLVVVTSMQVLDVWKREVSIHVEPTLKIGIFHGSSRPRSPEGVVDHDLVLTTYATLSADSKDLRVLQKIEWFRVVLDEAHFIRNQSSDQFCAAESLNADRRWCLTGTPIQNRLNDLESLLKFLHFEPFSRTSVFQRQILEPLSKDTPDPVNLRVLLHAMCLRRSEKYLNLPVPKYEEVSVELEGEERIAYNDTLKKCARDIDELVSTQVKNKKYAILFAAIMKLRRLCNHGTLSAAQISESTPLTPGKNGEADCEFCSGSDEDTLALRSNAEFCTECGRNVSPVNPKSPESGSSNPSWPIDRCLTAQSSPIPGYVPGSTKLLTVVENLIKSPSGSKSLVFSYWTSTLYLLGELLQQRNIHFLRIDGQVSYAERLRILALFSEEPDIAVLLISIGTGSVGLNLTVANYVHLVEPQWNPSVEEQAIARVLRIGQTRPVTVMRYVAKKTVEETILSLQQKKRTLAKFTLDSGQGEGESGKLQVDDLQFILDLNPA